MNDDINKSDIKKNVSSGHIWFRLVYMILFSIVLQVSVAVFWLVTLIQFLFALLTGSPNPKLALFADSLCQYIAQIVRFESFVSEEKPFPFSDFPDAEPDLSETEKSEAGQVEARNEGEAQ